MAGVLPDAASGHWRIFMLPSPLALPVAGDQLISLPRPKSPRWLGALGHVTTMTRTYSCPGGPDTLSLLLRLPADYRTDAINPGRIIQVWRGGSCVWEGKLDEPQPGTNGWTVTAHGAGTYGTDFAAIYTTWNADDAVNQAIARGMRWSNPGIGAPKGIFLGQQQDSGSQTVTDHLNLLITGGGLLWLVTEPAASSPPAGPWTLGVVPFTQDANGNPVRKPDRLLVCNSPVGRTVTANVNVMVLRYQATADISATGTKAAVPATFAVTTTEVASSVAQFGPSEFYLDVSSVGVLTAAKAQAIGQNILSRFVRASFAGPFTAAPGQVFNAAGTPVDMGMDQAGLVYQVLVTDAPFGGEVSAPPLVFLSGEYEFDEDTGSAIITPFQSARTDLGSLISSLYPTLF